MPVRSLNSSVLKWPDAATVLQALKEWVAKATKNRPDILLVGYFGSYARGDWGVGSDLDLLMVVDDSLEPFERRALPFDTAALPVPCDLLIYTRQEWRRLTQQGIWGKTMTREIKWVYGEEPMKADDPVVLETFPNRALAEMAAGFLAGEGIEALVMADDAGGAYPMLQFIRGVRLLVAPEDEARAREALNALEHPEPPEEEM
jgi:hypothetical protein